MQYVKVKIMLHKSVLIVLVKFVNNFRNLESAGLEIGADMITKRMEMVPRKLEQLHHLHHLNHQRKKVHRAQRNWKIILQ